MPRRSTVPRPFERLEKLVTDRLVDERGESASSSFLRGMAVGALVGAAIAGSAMWERRAARRRGSPVQPESEPDRPPS